MSYRDERRKEKRIWGREEENEAEHALGDGVPTWLAQGSLCSPQHQRRGSRGEEEYE